MKPMRDAASEQLCEYKERAKPSILTTSWGVHVPSMTAILTAGKYGGLLSRDSTFDDVITHFDRERIPERVVHAKGAGAFGYFECTHDISKYTKAKLFQVGKKTHVTCRFSQVTGEMGSADTVRDPRGFALKFKTEEGVWDLVGNNTPIFFVRDPILFPSFIHSQKRNPVTHLKDPNAAWDFFSLRPEATHQFLFLYSDRGIPYSYRHMDGFGQHTFKLVNAQGEPVWCKFHYKTDQGIKNLDPTLANEIAGTDPDWFIRDLYNAIHDKNYPSWTLYIQVMTFEQAKSFPWNIFDVTKVWPKKEFPLIEVGKIVLNENPENYFEDVEQLAVCPSRMVPGIEPSEDKMLQGRMVSYGDTQRYRLGVNFQQLPVNCPYAVRPKNMERDGSAAYNNQKGAPNYFPNSFGGPEVDCSAKTSPYEVHGVEDRWDSGGDDNFSQATMFWRNVLKPDERSRLINNVAQNLGLAKNFIQERALKNFYQVDEELGQRMREALKLQDKAMAHL